MKRFYIFLFLLAALISYPDPIYDSYNFSRTTVEPVSWSPDEGIYSNAVYLSLSSEYGKIYYVVNSSFGEKEPELYKNEIVLEGKAGGIADYRFVSRRCGFSREISILGTG